MWSFLKGSGGWMLKRHGTRRRNDPKNGKLKTHISPHFNRNGVKVHQQQRHLLYRMAPNVGLCIVLLPRRGKIERSSRTC